MPSPTHADIIEVATWVRGSIPSTASAQTKESIDQLAMRLIAAASPSRAGGPVAMHKLLEGAKILKGLVMEAMEAPAPVAAPAVEIRGVKELGPKSKKAPVKGWYVWATDEDMKWVRFHGPYPRKGTAQKLMQAWSEDEALDAWGTSMSTVKELKRMYGPDSGQSAANLALLFGGLNPKNQAHLETVLGVPFMSSAVARPAQPAPAAPAPVAAPAPAAPPLLPNRLFQTPDTPIFAIVELIPRVAEGGGSVKLPNLPLLTVHQRTGGRFAVQLPGESMAAGQVFQRKSGKYGVALSPVAKFPGEHRKRMVVSIDVPRKSFATPAEAIAYIEAHADREPAAPVEPFEAKIRAIVHRGDLGGWLQTEFMGVGEVAGVAPGVAVVAVTGGTAELEQARKNLRESGQEFKESYSGMSVFVLDRAAPTAPAAAPTPKPPEPAPAPAKPALRPHPPEEVKVRGHYEIREDKTYADSGVLQTAGSMPGASVEHMGFGEFYVQTPQGRIDFHRRDSMAEDFPEFSGRVHQVTGDPLAALVAFTEWMEDSPEIVETGVEVEEIVAPAPAPAPATPTKYGITKEQLQEWMELPKLDGDVAISVTCKPASDFVESTPCELQWFISASGEFDNRYPEGYYSLNGPTGEHPLNAATTNIDRLWEHWTGYVDNSRGAAGIKIPEIAGELQVRELPGPDWENPRGWLKEIYAFVKDNPDVDVDIKAQLRDFDEAIAEASSLTEVQDVAEELADALKEPLPHDLNTQVLQEALARKIVLDTPQSWAFGLLTEQMTPLWKEIQSAQRALENPHCLYPEHAVAQEQLDDALGDLMGMINPQGKLSASDAAGLDYLITEENYTLWEVAGEVIGESLAGRLKHAINLAEACGAGQTALFGISESEEGEVIAYPPTPAALGDTGLPASYPPTPAPAPAVPPGPGVRSPIHGMSYTDWLIKFFPFGLTEDEMVVLAKTKRMKPSYRRKEAAEHGVDATRYEEALESLQGMALIRSNNAISPAGSKLLATLVEANVVPQSELSYLFKAQPPEPTEPTPTPEPEPDVGTQDFRDLMVAGSYGAFTTDRIVDNTFDYLGEEVTVGDNHDGTFRVSYWNDETQRAQNLGSFSDAAAAVQAVQAAVAPAAPAAPAPLVIDTSKFANIGGGAPAAPAPAQIDYANLDNWKSVRRGDGLDVLRSEDGVFEIRSYQDSQYGMWVYDLYYQPPGSVGALKFYTDYESALEAAEAADLLSYTPTMDPRPAPAAPAAPTPTPTPTPAPAPAGISIAVEQLVDAILRQSPSTDFGREPSFGANSFLYLREPYFVTQGSPGWAKKFAFPASSFTIYKGRDVAGGTVIATGIPDAAAAIRAVVSQGPDFERFRSAAPAPAAPAPLRARHPKFENATDAEIAADRDLTVRQLAGRYGKSVDEIKRILMEQAKTPVYGEPLVIDTSQFANIGGGAPAAPKKRRKTTPKPFIEDESGQRVYLPALPETSSQTQWIQLFWSKLNYHLKPGTVYHQRSREVRVEGYGDSNIYINYFNLPQKAGVGFVNEGAEAENNRLFVIVELLYDGRAKLTVEIALQGAPKLRGRTSSAEKIATYLAEYLSEVATWTPPRYTHSTPPSPLPKWNEVPVAPTPAPAPVDADRAPVMNRDRDEWARDLGGFGLTEDEFVVLVNSERLKPSYRRGMAKGNGVNEERYDRALEGLQAKNLLAKNKSITSTGRDMVARMVDAEVARQHGEVMQWFTARVGGHRRVTTAPAPAAPAPEPTVRVRTGLGPRGGQATFIEVTKPYQGARGEELVKVGRRQGVGAPVVLWKAGGVRGEELFWFVADADGALLDPTGGQDGGFYSTLSGAEKVLAQLTAVGSEAAPAVSAEDWLEIGDIGYYTTARGTEMEVRLVEFRDDGRVYIEDTTYAKGRAIDATDVEWPSRTAPGELGYVAKPAAPKQHTIQVEVHELYALPQPLVIESQGEENVYFYDDLGQRYFLKFDAFGSEIEIIKSLGPGTAATPAPQKRSEWSTPQGTIRIVEGAQGRRGTWHNIHHGGTRYGFNGSRWARGKEPSQAVLDAVAVEGWGHLFGIGPVSVKRAVAQRDEPRIKRAGDITVGAWREDIGSEGEIRRELLTDLHTYVLLPGVNEAFGTTFQSLSIDGGRGEPYDDLSEATAAARLHYKARKAAQPAAPATPAPAAPTVPLSEKLTTVPLGGSESYPLETRDTSGNELRVWIERKKNSTETRLVRQRFWKGRWANPKKNTYMNFGALAVAAGTLPRQGVYYVSARSPEAIGIHPVGGVGASGESYKQGTSYNKTGPKTPGYDAAAALLDWSLAFTDEWAARYNASRAAYESAEDRSKKQYAADAAEGAAGTWTPKAPLPSIADIKKMRVGDKLKLDGPVFDRLAAVTKKARSQWYLTVWQRDPDGVFLRSPTGPVSIMAVGKPSPTSRSVHSPEEVEALLKAFRASADGTFTAAPAPAPAAPAAPTKGRFSKGQTLYSGTKAILVEEDVTAGLSPTAAVKEYYRVRVGGRELHLTWNPTLGIWKLRDSVGNDSQVLPREPTPHRTANRVVWN